MTTKTLPKTSEKTIEIKLVNTNLEEAIQQMAYTAHRTYHGDHGYWWDCPRNICYTAQQAIPWVVEKLKGPEQ